MSSVEELREAKRNALEMAEDIHLEISQLIEKNNKMVREKRSAARKLEVKADSINLELISKMRYPSGNVPGLIRHRRQAIDEPLPLLLSEQDECAKRILSEVDEDALKKHFGEELWASFSSCQLVQLHMEYAEFKKRESCRRSNFFRLLLACSSWHNKGESIEDQDFEKEIYCTLCDFKTKNGSTMRRHVHVHFVDESLCDCLDCRNVTLKRKNGSGDSIEPVSEL